MTTVTYEHRDPNELVCHPLNVKIYGEEIDDEFVESCKEGILFPLGITKDNVVFSGHRRMQAAIKNKLPLVPVVVHRDMVDPLDIEFALLRANEYRMKSTDLRLREFAEYKRIEDVRAAERQSAAGGDKKSNDAKSLPQHDKIAGVKMTQPIGGKSAEIAAKRAGLSKNTAKKGTAVVQKIDELKAAGKTEEAEKLRETLNKNVSEAHRQVAPPEPRKPKNGAAIDTKAIDKKIDKAFGEVVRGFDDRKKALGGKGDHYTKCMDTAMRLSEFFDAWKDAKGQR